MFSLYHVCQAFGVTQKLLNLLQKPGKLGKYE